MSSSSDDELVFSSSKRVPAGGKRRAVVISDEDDDLSSVSSISAPSESDESEGSDAREDSGAASSDSSFTAAVARAARRQASVSFEKLEDTPERPAAAAAQAGEGDAKSKQAAPGSRLASALPLVFPKQTKKGRACAVVQVEDAGFDLSGDVGAIGRLAVVPNEGLILDLKGHQYAGTIVPSCSMFVVGFGPTEAKIETVVSDFVQTDHLANIIDTLSGSLLSGDAAAALLAFEDVDPEAGEAAAAGGVLRGRGDEGDEDEEDGDLADEALDPGAALRKMEKKLSGGKKAAGSKRDRATAGLDDEEGGGEGSKPAAKRAKTTGAGKVAAKGVYGKAMKVSRSGKRLTKKAAGGGAKKPSSGGAKKATAASAAKKPAAAAKKPAATKKKKAGSSDEDTEEDSYEEDDSDDSDWE